MMPFTIAVILAMSIGTVEPVAAQPYALSFAEVKAIKQGVRGSLLNPAAARFSGMRAVRAGAGVVRVCGQVNTTNGRNVYIGNRVFVGTLTAPPASSQIVFTEINHVDLSAAGATCRQYGIPGF